MGGSQSQENQSQTFSTIGLPSTSLYPRPERSQSLRVPHNDSSTGERHYDSSNGHTRERHYDSSTGHTRERHYDSSTRERHYRSHTAQISDDSDDWLRVDAPPPPPPPRAHHTPSPDSRPTRREPHPPAHSLREFDEYDLEQLLSTLHSLRLGARSSSSEAAQDQPRTEAAQDQPRTESRRRHHHSSSGRHRQHRLRHPFLFLRPVPDVTCPLCSKEFSPTQLEEHLPSCSQRPRVQFNEDKLLQGAGECSICLEDMEAGDAIARLPCLCVYHLHCLRGWYTKSQTCPEHPDMKGI